MTGPQGLNKETRTAGKGLKDGLPPGPVHPPQPAGSRTRTSKKFNGEGQDAKSSSSPASRPYKKRETGVDSRPSSFTDRSSFCKKCVLTKESGLTPAVQPTMTTGLNVVLAPGNPVKKRLLRQRANLTPAGRPMAATSLKGALWAMKAGTSTMINHRLIKILRAPLLQKKRLQAKGRSVRNRFTIR